MPHNNIRSIVNVISPKSDVPVVGVSDFFLVVGKGFHNSKPTKLHIGVAVPAPGTLSIQVFYTRSGTKNPICTIPVGMSTTASYIASSALNNVTLIEGDLVTFELVTFTGTALGISVTLDLLG